MVKVLLGQKVGYVNGRLNMSTHGNIGQVKHGLGYNGHVKSWVRVKVRSNMVNLG